MNTTRPTPTISLNLPNNVQQALRDLIVAKVATKASEQERRVSKAKARLEEELRWEEERKLREEQERFWRELREDEKRRDGEEAEAEARIRRAKAEAEERRVAGIWKRYDINFYSNEGEEKAFLPHQSGCGVGRISEWSQFGPYDHDNALFHASWRNQGRKPRKPWFRRRSPDLPWPV